MTARGPLRVVTIPDPNTALGVAARMMMTHPAFAGRSFGEWTQVLEGQARRGHQVFVIDGTDRAVGCFGYALASEAVAEAWLRRGYAPTHEECSAGDCLIFNAWLSEDARTLRFMWNVFRLLARDKRAAFYKRYYADGSVRPVRLNINAAVEGHIDRARSGSGTTAAEDAAPIGNSGG